MDLMNNSSLFLKDYSLCTVDPDQHQQQQQESMFSQAIKNLHLNEHSAHRNSLANRGVVHQPNKLYPKITAALARYNVSPPAEDASDELVVTAGDPVSIHKLYPKINRLDLTALNGCAAPVDDESDDNELVNAELFYNETATTTTNSMYMNDMVDDSAADLASLKRQDEIEIYDRNKPNGKEMNASEYESRYAAAAAVATSNDVAVGGSTAGNLIEMETVKNKLSSLWNNVKYGKWTLFFLLFLFNTFHILRYIWKAYFSSFSIID